MGQFSSVSWDEKEKKKTPLEAIRVMLLLERKEKKKKKKKTEWKTERGRRQRERKKNEKRRVARKEVDPPPSDQTRISESKSHLFNGCDSRRIEDDFRMSHPYSIAIASFCQRQ